MVRVKICGVTRWEDAHLACELGASALGFNFYEKSPRVITPAAAWDIIRRLPPFVAPVGVFVNWQPSAVVALAKSLHLGAVQLHGDEDAACVAACTKDLPVIKALHVGKDFSLAQLKQFKAASAFLCDAVPTGGHAGEFGGTGQRANWEAARDVAKSRCVILAGGLTPEIVREAIRYVCPYAVDVASGVESAPGVKDPVKLRDFFSAVALSAS
jgi:phosphoribosylanthranilate isomerase